MKIRVGVGFTYHVDVTSVHKAIFAPWKPYRNLKVVLVNDQVVTLSTYLTTMVSGKFFTTSIMREKNPLHATKPVVTLPREKR